MAQDKRKFRNMTTGHIGVVIENDSGKMAGIALAPGEGVELTEREQRATANAPRDPKDNPFVGGYTDPDTGATGPALVEVDDALEVQRPIGSKPAAPAPSSNGDPDLGSREDGEEVGTPDAPAKRQAAKKATRPKVTS
jgi:hypothetical protein